MTDPLISNMRCQLAGEGSLILKRELTEDCHDRGKEIFSSQLEGSRCRPATANPKRWD